MDGGSNVDVSLAVQSNQLSAVAVAKERARTMRSKAIEFSIFGLPIRTQAVYAVLLTIPIGAFVMVILRNIVGLESFGTFLPVLVALSFRETELIWGLALFTLLVSLGLSIRFLLERLRLLLVPRLTAVLIVVVILMLMVSVLAHRLGLETGLSIAPVPDGHHIDGHRADVGHVGKNAVPAMPSRPASVRSSSHRSRISSWVSMHSST